MMQDRKGEKGKKKTNQEAIEGFDIRINEFGEMTTNINIDQINSFLNTHLSDRKLHNKVDEEE